MAWRLAACLLFEDFPIILVILDTTNPREQVRHWPRGSSNKPFSVKASASLGLCLSLHECVRRTGHFSTEAMSICHRQGVEPVIRRIINWQEHSLCNPQVMPGWKQRCGPCVAARSSCIQGNKPKRTARKAVATSKSTVLCSSS